jgi:hypothetical protein
MKSLIGVPEPPIKFAALCDFVWWLKCSGVRRDAVKWYELLGKYTCDDNGVYTKSP